MIIDGNFCFGFNPQTKRGGPKSPLPLVEVVVVVADLNEQ